MELAAEGVVRRRAGVLLHPTSLPGALGQGDLGPQAYHFVDWLAASGFAVWQMLPLGPVHSDGSPYQCLSAFAGNPQLISPHLLLERGWLPANAALDSQPTAVRQAFDRWYTAGSPQHDQSYRHFIQQHQSWLEDFALFVALRELHEGESWSSWPSALRDREPAALAHVREQQAELLAWISFQQYLFFEQWGSLKRYANQRGVELLGDMPIFVAYDSADVWSQRQLFLLDDKGMPTVVAGVPPDYFSTTGQRWGNPLYHWEILQKSEFAWWTKRFEHQ
ncbi:MAG: 4-alpha-glucanotransferase, partial [Halothiobacillaceae bacterium]